MYRSGLLRVLLRRWYLALFGVAATAGLCLGAAKAVPVTYQAKAYALLVPAASDINNPNPYLSVGGVTAPADILARAMSDSTTVTALRKSGIPDTYTVSRDLTTNGPMVLIVADDKTPAGALGTLKAVVARLEPTMRRLQQALSPPVPTRFQITTQPVLVDEKASPVRKSQIRALLVALVVGAVGSVFAISLIDGVLGRRRAKKPPAIETRPSRDADAPTMPNGRGRIKIGQSALTQPPNVGHPGLRERPVIHRRVRRSAAKRNG
jgi:hypothetical protein